MPACESMVLSFSSRSIRGLGLIVCVLLHLELSFVAVRGRPTFLLLRVEEYPGFLVSFVEDVLFFFASEAGVVWIYI